MPRQASRRKNLSDYKYSSYNNFFNDCDLIDKDFVLGIIPIELFEQFNNENTNDKCLEI